MNEESAPVSEFWRLAKVLAVTGFSRSTLYRHIAECNFPAPRKYAATNRSFWLSNEVRDWQRGQLGDDFEALL